MSKPKPKRRRGDAPPAAVSVPPPFVPAPSPPAAPPPTLLPAPAVVASPDYAWVFGYALTVSDGAGQWVTTYANECTRMHPIQWLGMIIPQMRQRQQPAPALLFVMPVSAAWYDYACRVLYGRPTSPHDDPQVPQR